MSALLLLHITHCTVSNVLMQMNLDAQKLCRSIVQILLHHLGTVVTPVMHLCAHQCCEHCEVSLNAYIWCRLSMANTGNRGRPARFTFQLLQLSTPAPRTLLLLHDKHQNMLVCPKQVYNSCLHQHCKYQAFYRQCSIQTKPMVLTEQDTQLQQLTHLAGLSSTASKLSVVSLASCCKAMEKSSLRVPQELLAAFVQLKDRPGEQTVVASQHVCCRCLHEIPQPHKAPDTWQQLEIL